MSRFRKKRGDLVKPELETMDSRQNGFYERETNTMSNNGAILLPDTFIYTFYD